MSGLIASHIRCVRFLSSPAAPCCCEPSLRSSPFVALQRAASVLVRVPATRRSSIMHLLHGSALGGADGAEERKKRDASVSLFRPSATCTTLQFCHVTSASFALSREHAPPALPRAGVDTSGAVLRDPRCYRGWSSGLAPDKLRWASREGSAM